MTTQRTAQTKTAQSTQAAKTPSSVLTSPAHPVLNLQRQVGNQATTSMIQAKLTVGEANDAYEQEADRVAAAVVRQIHPPAATSQSPQANATPTPQIQPLVQRQGGSGGMEAPAHVEAGIQQARGSGQPLPEGLRSFMEQAFGADFSGVRVHTGGDSDRLNQAVQAKAFTTGQNIFFRQGTYDPGSSGGQELIAHELTHVVQQRSNEPSQALGLLRSTPVGAIQRKVLLDVEGVPNKNDIVHIRSIERPSTPDTTNLTGENSVDPAARHIIPWALMEREFKSRYSGRTIAQLETIFTEVKIDRDYGINLAAAMQRVITFENNQLNRGRGGNLVEGATPDSARFSLMKPELKKRILKQPKPTAGKSAYSKIKKIGQYTVGNKPDDYRNYWEGSQDENLSKDKSAQILLDMVVKNWEAHFGVASPSSILPTDPAWVTWYKKYADECTAALAEEFDPPPFTSQKVIQQAAREWARLTNQWLTNDPISKGYYYPGRDLQWQDAVNYGANKKVYDNSPKK
ncbi:MAG: DUF4157 domain-containing protein [Leptolyngbyaceae cyanobacterium bins.302]|nr:DUF4157 domain-containing protein [Leptolyngbyaceae cyanobacterium bins.302]